MTECDARDFLLKRFREEQLFTDHGPVVATRQHSGDPHYEPTPATNLTIEKGDFVLIDMWAKRSEPNAPYYDITWTASYGAPSETVQNVFSVVTSARDAATI